MGRKLRTFSSYQLKFHNRNKYQAVRTETGGVVYDSKFEARYADQLEWRRRAGEISEIKRQHRIDIRINGQHWRDYVIDFRVVLPDGRIQYIEVKGFPTKEWKQKWDVLLIVKDEILEPGAELVLVR